MKRNEKALADFTNALELEPDYAFAYHGRGRCLTDLGRYREAVEEYTKAIERMPVFTDALNRRAELYRKLGEVKLAEADMNRIREIKQEGLVYTLDIG